MSATSASVLYLGEMITVSAVPNACTPLGRRLDDYEAAEAEQQEKLKSDDSLTYDALQGWLINAKRIGNNSSSGEEWERKNEKRKRDEHEQAPQSVAVILADPSKAFATWTKENDAHLKGMKEGREKKSWATIAKCFPGKTEKACEQRYHNKLKIGKKRVVLVWSPANDARLKSLKEVEGKSWAAIAKAFPERTEQACMNRYHNHLNGASPRKRPKGAAGSLDAAIVKDNEFMKFIYKEENS
jgi:hypothetical protein